jgi:hypothetical protein
MTFAELKADLYRRLEESSVSPVFVSEDDIEDALNDGYLDLSDATEWREVWRTVDLLAGRPYYDLRTLFRDVNVLTPLGAFHEDTNRWLTPISPRDLDGGYARWEQVSGPPDRLFTRGLWWIAYHPAIGSATGTVKQYVTALPDPLEDDDDEPGFDEDFHPALVEYALAEILPQYGEVTAALKAWEAYGAYEAGLTAHVQGRGSVARVHGYH